MVIQGRASVFPSYQFYNVTDTSLKQFFLLGSSQYKLEMKQTETCTYCWVFSNATQSINKNVPIPSSTVQCVSAIFYILYLHIIFVMSAFPCTGRRWQRHRWPCWWWARRCTGRTSGSRTSSWSIWSSLREEEMESSIRIYGKEPRLGTMPCLCMNISQGMYISSISIYQQEALFLCNSVMCLSRKAWD